MPRCYLLAVAQGSAIDYENNHLSLFDLAEEIGLQADTELVTERLEIHCYLEFQLAERQRKYDVRFKITRNEGEEFYSTVHHVEATTPRLRMRSRGFMVPGTGQITVRAEWCEAETNAWTDAGQAWPIEARHVVAPETPDR